MQILEIDYTPSPTGIPEATLPLSKSIAARCLLKAYYSGAPMPQHLPDCDDTQYLLRALQQLREASGRGGEIDVDLGSGATSLRFFTVAAASTPGVTARINCSAQLRRRPMAPLLKALRECGADIETPGSPDAAPLLVHGRRLQGGTINIEASASSQYVSAFLLAAPFFSGPLNIAPDGEKIVSTPYIRMTERIAALQHIPDIESDWSAASYFYEYVFLSRSPLRIMKLTPPEKSLQGDSRCAVIFHRLGVETHFESNGNALLTPNPVTLDALSDSGDIVELDLGSTPDLTPAVAVALAVAGIRFRISGIAHLRIKECDRLEAISNELRRLGFNVQAGLDFLFSDGSRIQPSAYSTISTYGDHRIAMAFAMAATRLGSIAIADPDVVSKSFPSFWQASAPLGLLTKSSTL